MGEIATASIKWYQCTTWAEGDTHGGDIDTGSEITSGAPELSAELGKRISAIEDSNVTLLKRFFDQKRREVDKFIEDEWVPEFAEQFFSDQAILAAWDTIVKEDDKKQRLTFLVITGPKLQKKINKKRLELIQPLDDLERRIEKQIRYSASEDRRRQIQYLCAENHRR